MVNKGLCSGCGTCSGVCAKGCISFEGNGFTPVFNPSECVDCGLCYKACPSAGFKFTALSRQGSEWDDTIGPYVSFVNCHSTNPVLRKNGASGGTVSGIFEYVLEKGLVDRVVCVEKRGEEFLVLLTDNPDDLQRTQGSKYIPIPLNTALREIIRNRWRVAVIGTPCQLQGIEKAMSLLPVLRECIKYRIGLFCGFAQPKTCLDALRRYMKAEGPTWRFDGWRCGEYPGYIRFTNTETDEKKDLLIYEGLNIAVPFYSMDKCFMCPDGVNMCADIAVGDIHSRGDNENCGIIRTQNGAALIEMMIKDCCLDAEFISKDEAMKSTVGTVSYLKGMRSLLFINTSKKAVPDYDISFDKSKYKPILVAQNRLQLSLYRLARKKRVIAFLEKHPNLQMKVGRYLYTFPSQSIFYRLLRAAVKLIKRK